MRKKNIINNSTNKNIYNLKFYFLNTLNYISNNLDITFPHSNSNQHDLRVFDFLLRSKVSNNIIKYYIILKKRL